jgi:predicted nucleotidyltransferase
MLRGGGAMVSVLQEKHEVIARLCAQFGVVRLDVFGSVLRDDYRPGESDVDLLAEFAPMEPHALADAYFGLLDALRELLGGEVDLVMSDAVKNRYVAREIERTKRLLYAA